MYCSSCGEKLSDDQNFCTKCGTAVKGRSLRIIRLKCSECQGIMDVDFDKQVIQCPYCGSKSLLIESDKIKIEQIRSSASLEKEKVHQYSMIERDKITKEMVLEKQRIRSEAEIKKAIETEKIRRKAEIKKAIINMDPKTKSEFLEQLSSLIVVVAFIGFVVFSLWLSNG